MRRPTHSNTSWDFAKDEIPAHKWVDVSQRNYGVALLDDCKYGHRVKNNTLELNLLRSVPYPGSPVFDEARLKPGEPNHRYTDQRDHHFTYSLFPHQGDLVDGGVVKAAYELNFPLRMILVKGKKLSQPRGNIGLGAPLLAVDAPNIVIEAVKKAEDSDAIIVRLYEASNSSVRTTLRTAFALRGADEVDLLEENSRKLEVRDDAVQLAFKPFEVKTVRLARLS